MSGKVKAIPEGYEGATNILGSSFRSWQHRAQDANRLLDRDAVSGAFGFGQIGQFLSGQRYRTGNRHRVLQNGI